MVKKINETEFNSLDKSGVMVVDFNATWCGPCKMLAPVLEQVSEEYDGKVAFYSVDTDENPNLAREFGIVSIPALALIKDGNKADMSIGFVPKESITEFIDRNL